MVRGAFWATLFGMVLLVNRISQAQTLPRSEKSLGERVRLLEERFAREAAENGDAQPRNADIEPLLAILNREKMNGVSTRLYRQVLEELGRFPDDHLAMRALVENIDELAINAPT